MVIKNTPALPGRAENVVPDVVVYRRLSNDDRDANENGKKALGLYRLQNSRFFSQNQ